MPVPARPPLLRTPAEMNGGMSPIPGGSSLPPTPMAAAQGGGGLGTAARLHDLSADLRAIHNAMLPSPIHQALNQLGASPNPSPDLIRETLSAILDHAESLLDALVACRLLEPAVDAAAARPGPQAILRDAQHLKGDYENLIGQLAGRLGLGALDSILRADALGRLRGQVRRYRLTRWPARGQPQPPAPVAAAASPPPLPAAEAPVSDDSESTVARGWLRHPFALPRRNSAFSLGAAMMAIIMPVCGAWLIPGTPEAMPTWAALIAMTCTATTASILTSPFRWPAKRARAARPADSQPPVAPPPAAPQAPTEASSYDLWLHEVKRQGMALSAQGVPVETMDQAALTDWIERSGEEIARLIDKARAQSIAADMQDDGGDGYDQA